ncbi:MAG: hypothetical protein PHU85_08720 [Phycisphaerae bacterium]|nr:hypothetical protein [Phycisphaerae bacterium]
MIEAATFILLADGATRLRNVQQYFNRKSDDPWGTLLFWMIALTVATGLLILGLRHARWQRRRQPPGKPWRLFKRLVAEAGLGWGDRRRLARLARRACPEAPTAILLSPGALEFAIRQSARGEPADKQKRLAAQLAPVAATLFRATGE